MVKSEQRLPPIPEKQYFTIGETAELCLVKPHVLRYWEQEFAQLKPLKRNSNRRCYQQQDIRLIREIRDLLHVKGYTIGGAKHFLVKAKAEQIAKKPKEEPRFKPLFVETLRELCAILKFNGA